MKKPLGCGDRTAHKTQNAKGVYGRHFTKFDCRIAVGELMMEEELTWQAVGMYVVFLALGGVAIAWGMAKAVRAWRDALK